MHTVAHRFNSPFEYSHESVGDMSLVSSDVNMFVARGGSLATEWGKKGHTLMRIGCDHQNDPALLLAILDECERAGVYAMYTPSMANQIVNTGQRGFDMAGLVSNLTLVKDHPALWGCVPSGHMAMLSRLTSVGTTLAPRTLLIARAQSIVA